MNTATKKMSEEQAVHLVRNALLVAGSEMGAEGDHWPVIKSTIHSVMQDWENLKVERNVSAELKKHIGDVLNEMEASLPQCSPDILPEATAILKGLRELYEARFEPVDRDLMVICDADKPMHIRRTNSILKTLEEDNE